jgi:hypothetical protein
METKERRSKTFNAKAKVQRNQIITIQRSLLLDYSVRANFLKTFLKKKKIEQAQLIQKTAT